MSIATELGRIQADRDAIKTKLKELGMATDSDNLDRLTMAIEAIINRGAVSGKISSKAGKYTIPAGYHNGSGSVQIDGGEQAKLISTNICSGVTILGVAGTAGITASDDGAGNVTITMTGVSGITVG